MSDLTIRAAEASEHDVMGVYNLLLRMFEESPMQALDPQKAKIEIARVCGEEPAWIVERDGKIIASIGLALASYWYSDDEILHTRWFYTLPEYRTSDGAFSLMMHEVRELVNATGIVAWIDVANPLKPHLGGKLQVAFRRFSCDPRGLRMMIVPAAKELEVA